MDLWKIPWEVVDWIDTVQDRDQWQALVSMVMNFRLIKKDSIPWNYLVS
jgi:hypothetical protein